MSEKMGILAFLIIFTVFLLPFSLEYFTESVKANHMLLLSNEFHQLMVAEGDITPHIQNTVSNFEEKGVVIKFWDMNGNQINSVDVGEKIRTTYEFQGYEIENTMNRTKR